MDAFLQTIRNLGPTRLAVAGSVIMLMIGFFIFLTARLASPQLALLYSDLDPGSASQIAQQLRGQKIEFDIRNNGTAVYVPSNEAPRLRMEMASKGMATGGIATGYDIFDKQDTLSTTNFMQNVNLVRALEGEISRTIRSLVSVYSARVHLVTPKRELFSREKQEPSASLVLKMRGSNRLSHEQVLAVQAVVAGAVPGLTPNRISIVDDKGSLLARGFEDESSPDFMARKSEERRVGFERRMTRTIEELLENTVGFGKVRAEVSAQIDFDRISTTEEKYDPEGQVVRSTQTIEEQGSSKESEADRAVSVAQNLPDAIGAGESATATSAEQRTEEVVNFEISKKVVSHTREGGVVKRLSVAVLVDGKYGPEVAPETEEPIYKDRTKAEMENLAVLVRNAIGFDADRGDSVEVINMRFAEPTIPEEPQIELFFGFDKDDLLRMAEIMVLSIVAILVILLVVRPLVSRAFESLPSAVEAAEGLLAERAPAPALAGPGGAPLPVLAEGVPEEESFEELIDIDRVEGRVKASSVKKVGEIVEKHPEEALSILRSWMYQEG